MNNSILEAKATYEGCKINCTTSLHVVNCGMCGGTYALSTCYVNKKREHGGFWTCPYCKCSWGYSKDISDVQKLKDQLVKQKDSTAYQRLEKERALDKASHLERSRNGMKGALKKSQKKLDRVKNGVCPCCNRHFKNLGLHMNNQHPDFQEEKK